MEVRLRGRRYVLRLLLLPQDRTVKLLLLLLLLLLLSVIVGVRQLWLLGSGLRHLDQGSLLLSSAGLRHQRLLWLLLRIAGIGLVTSWPLLVGLRRLLRVLNPLDLLLSRRGGRIGVPLLRLLLRVRLLVRLRCRGHPLLLVRLIGLLHRLSSGRVSLRSN